jgi:hypothetical protein
VEEDMRLLREVKSVTLTGAGKTISQGSMRTKTKVKIIAEYGGDQK